MNLNPLGFLQLFTWAIYINGVPSSSPTCLQVSGNFSAMRASWPEDTLVMLSSQKSRRALKLFFFNGVPNLRRPRTCCIHLLKINGSREKPCSRRKWIFFRNYHRHWLLWSFSADRDVRLNRSKTTPHRSAGLCRLASRRGSSAPEVQAGEPLSELSDSYIISCFSGWWRLNYLNCPSLSYYFILV